MRILLKPGRFKGDPQIMDLMKRQREWTRELLKQLSKDFGFVLPASLAIGVLDPPKYWALTTYHPLRGFTIATDGFLQWADGGFWVIRHECCHVAECILYGDMGHGDNFLRVQEVCQSYKM